MKPPKFKELDIFSGAILSLLYIEGSTKFHMNLLLEHLSKVADEDNKYTNRIKQTLTTLLS